MSALAGVRALLSALADRPVTVVCIDGRGGSGKTTLAGVLAAEHSTVVHADDFYGPEEADWASWSPEQGYERYFDHQRLIREVLEPVRSGRDGRYQRYDWQRRELGDVAVVAARGIVVVEGVYLLKPALRRYWDVAIWVETPREVALARCYARGENDSGWIERWAAAEDYYLAVSHPQAAADFRIVGTACGTDPAG